MAARRPALAIAMTWATAGNFALGHAPPLATRAVGLLAAWLAVWLAACLATATVGFAQSAPPPATAAELAHCPGLVAADRPRATPVALKLAGLAPDEARLTFIGHATFLIESPQLVRIATDYNDYVRPPVIPDIVTMNHAHGTHFSDRPDPAIKYVLRGWGQSENEPARHDLKYRDVRVRNVPTNIRNGSGGTERYGNSIFIFELANLCIVHLGHLHHALTRPQLEEIGRPDVVLAPVDGNYTLDLDGMMEVLRALKASLIIPMHYFGEATLERFLGRAKEEWPVERAQSPSIVVAKRTLPASPKVLILPGY